MVTFFLAGGAPMLFVLGLGLAALIAAARFMRTPDPRRTGTVVALTLAAAFATLCGVATDIAAVGKNVAQNDELGADMPRVVLMGVSESMSPMILGGTLLCVTWLVMAVGYRRLEARVPTGS
jgi:hypothetical protein